MAPSLRRSALVQGRSELKFLFTGCAGGRGTPLGGRVAFGRQGKGSTMQGKLGIELAGLGEQKERQVDPGSRGICV